MEKFIAFVAFVAVLVWFAHCIIKPQGVKQIQEQTIEKLHYGNTKEARRLAEKQYTLDLCPETRHFKDSVISICDRIDSKNYRPEPIKGYMQPIAGKGICDYD